ncbi:serine hydrolase domain-containing protein [Alteromonas ponticola]|uniref:Beta-lactamase family protein n=1 Tax=Alteromonas ponticola TaxID=2720613 RepID=A0ABX1R240_9ALTE|nr:serine hydrolase domain-containing protein [Alteromonas ponticola]NMH59511.1 beta-lactamase family protein [Alteromonas ponticola]
MRYCGVTLFVFFLATFSRSASTEVAHTNLVKQIERIIIQENARSGFNGAVAIKLWDTGIFSYEIGYQQKGRPLTPSHLFSSGSVGKEFTTVAILKLARQGKLNLNDPVIDYLPNLPQWAKRITIHHLLSHTSGLPKIKWATNISTADVMSQILAFSKLEFEPGSQYLYGNINVMLRAKIVEKVTGMPFGQFLKTNFFAPFEMVNTVQIDSVDDKVDKVIGDFPTAINGVTIYTTPADLIRWEVALLNGEALAGSTLLSILSHHPLSDKHLDSEYDFGRFTLNDGTVATLEHDGSNPSHHVLKYSHIASQFTFVAMSSDGNKQNLYTLRDKIQTLVNSVHR